MRNPARIGLSVLAVLCWGEARAQAQQPTATYHSDAMKLYFSYPKSFKNMGDDSDRSGKNCISNPVAAMDARVGLNLIFLRRYDGVCLRKEIAASHLGGASSFLTDILDGFGKPEITKNTDYEISGHAASAVSGAVELKGVKPAGTVMYGYGSCVAVGKDLACFAFLSSDCGTLATISASTVKFADEVAESVIPPGLAIECKP